MSALLSPRVTVLIKRRMMDDMTGFDTLELIESMLDAVAVDRPGDLPRLNEEIEKILEVARQVASVPTDQVVDEIGVMLDLYIKHDLASYKCRFAPLGLKVNKQGVPRG